MSSQNTTRRALLGSGLAAPALLSAAPPQGAATPAGSRPPAYRIIYNWDGAPHGFSEYPQTVTQFLDKTFAPMKNTQVDAHFWCISEHEAKWRPTQMEFTGEPEDRRYDSAGSMRHNEGVRAMYDRGEDPYGAMVRRGRELGIAVWASIRMNDNHFNGLQPAEMRDTVMSGLTRLRKAHPEWCLGAKNTPKWFAASWNFAVPEIREHRFQHVTEVAKLADWDGIELDWQRHAFHLPIADAERLRYTLTDLQRAIRRMTNQIGCERGRPFYLAVRVATTLESCRRIGYDLPLWVKEGLCDVVIAGGGAGTDPGTDVEEFRKLLQGTPIRFYPGFDGGFWGQHTGLHADWNHAWVRAAAQGFWARGADGMYVFNWSANERGRRPLLTTIGAKETLWKTNKAYMSLHRNVIDVNGQWGGADLNDRIYGETPVELLRTLTGDGPEFHVRVFEPEANAASVELQIEVEHLTPEDKVKFTLNGAELGAPAVKYALGEDSPSDVGESAWLVWKLPAQAAVAATHTVKAVLLERHPRVRVPLVVRQVEIHVRY